ncbi:MAG: SusC/RagA family TonB-linked outer membrane protein [Bacteroidales bacterium]|nr:MAG: SusC/RagA family TonB-linked outer membrane protein [Bacteroidales bacterium]
MIQRVIRNAILNGFILLSLTVFQNIFSQEAMVKVTGTVRESITGEPLKQVLIAGYGADTSVVSDEHGQYEILVRSTDDLLTFQLPGYTTQQIYLYGRTSLDVDFVRASQKSVSDRVETPFGEYVYKDMDYEIEYLKKEAFEEYPAATFDEILQGKVAGLNVTGHSGIPGHRSYMSMGGISSIYGSNEPTVIIDGMVRETHYPVEGSIDGYTLNPFDIIDVDDILDVTVLRDAQSYLGSRVSNGIVYINSEQKEEASTEIRVHVYQGIVTSPGQLPLMDAGQFTAYLNEQITTQGLSQNEVDELFPWLNGESDPKYNNNTNWQDEIFKLGRLQKYHIFLKGGDNTANYNISTGYLIHKGIINNTSLSRFNLRINGKINITNKFSFEPNFKLSLADSYLQEQGYNQVTNPIIAASLKSPLMKPGSTPGETDDNFLEDIGVFDVSNPYVITKNLDAQSRNFQLLTSAKFNYNISKKLSVYSFVGIDVNNAWDKIFIPDFGLAMIDSARNQMGVSVTEYRSVQNNNQLSYSTNLENGNRIKVQLGNRIIMNSYEAGVANDLNSATDDFRSVGSGGEHQYLRSISGGADELNWISYYTTANYWIRDRYYFNAALSYEGNSTLNKNNRYNLFPYISAGWRILSGTSKIDDLKLRLSYGITGNLHNSAYVYSNLYYTGKRYIERGVVVRESVPNEDLELEKKMTVNLGADISALGKAFHAGINVFYAGVSNLIIKQTLVDAVGFNEYYDNGGSLNSVGINLFADYGFLTGNALWNVGFNVSGLSSKISRLDFIYNPKNIDYFLTGIEGAELISQVGEPVYSFYGFETDGVFDSETEANSLTGPNGLSMRAGDVKFVDQDGNDTINDLDKVIIGSPEPKLFGGLYTSFSKGRFKVDLDLYYSIGNDIYNYLAMRTHSMDNYYNQSEDITGRWNSSNTGSDIPGVSFGDPRGNNAFSDRWIEGGSYVKVKRLTVSYTLPEPSKYYKNIVVYVTGTNLLTLTKYSGYNPEFMFLSNPHYMGVDYGKIPFSRSFIIGIKLGL